MLVGDTGIEPVTSSVSGINTVLSTPPLSTKTVRGRPLTSPHIRGRCHAISQSPNHPHIGGRPRTSAGLVVGRPPVPMPCRDRTKGLEPRPRPDRRLRLRPVDPRSLEVQSVRFEPSRAIAEPLDIFHRVDQLWRTPESRQTRAHEDRRRRTHIVTIERATSGIADVRRSRPLSGRLTSHAAE